MAHRIIFAALICSVIFFGCISDTQSWMQGSIKGEGEVVTQEITLESLKGINLGFSGDVVLSPGSTQKIVLEGQQNILNNIKREVKNGIWNINFEKNVKEAKDVTVHITLPGIEEVKLSGSGSIHSTGKFASLNELNINVSGSGHITLEFDAQITDVELSGSGEIALSGSSKTLGIGISGSGDVTAGDLATDDCEIHISGSGDASVQVNKDLKTHISGSGDILYSGDPNVTTRISGSGDVSKLR